MGLKKTGRLRLVRGENRAQRRFGFAGDVLTAIGGAGWHGFSVQGAGCRVQGAGKKRSACSVRRSEPGRQGAGSGERGAGRRVQSKVWKARGKRCFPKTVRPVFPARYGRLEHGNKSLDAAMAGESASCYGVNLAVQRGFGFGFLSGDEKPHLGCANGRRDPSGATGLTGRRR